MGTGSNGHAAYKNRLRFTVALLPVLNYSSQYGGIAKSLLQFRVYIVLSLFHTIYSSLHAFSLLSVVSNQPTPNGGVPRTILVL
jgi:hypothetical protein